MTLNKHVLSSIASSSLVSAWTRILGGTEGLSPW